MRVVDDDRMIVKKKVGQRENGVLISGGGDM
jgi:hypothetical protein